MPGGYPDRGATGIGSHRAIRRIRHKPAACNKAALAIAFSLIAPAALASESLPAALPTLTTAKAVHQLSAAEAARGYPVRLHATITYFDPYLDFPQPILMVSDATGSVFVKLPLKTSPALRAGLLVEVLGQSVPGGFAPDVDRPQIRVLGASKLLKTAPLRKLSDLLLGSEDAPWVAMEGVVHAVQESDHNVTLKIAGSDGVFTAVTTKVAAVDYYHLINQKVRIRGIACSLFNKLRQIVGVQLRFADRTMVTVVDAAPAQPFEIPVSPIGSLLSYTPSKVFDRLVHIRGTVTLFWPGRLLCVQNGAGGLCAQTTQTVPLVPGDIADVAGFAQIGNYTPTLADATYRDSLRSEPIAVTTIAADETLHGEHDAQLVQIQGQLIGFDRAANDPSIILSSGKFIFSASLPNPLDARDLLRLEEGTKLSVTGICSVQADPNGSTDRDGYPIAKSIRILLRSPRDMVVLASPSWWNAAHTLRLLVFALVCISCVLAWVLVLRKRLERQTAQLQFQATHDGLTGLWNRTAILDILSREFARTARSGGTIGLMMLDVDHFKAVNDTHGHAAGDQVLKQIAERICAGVRAAELIGRYGGEEFLIVLPGSDATQVSAIAERVRLVVSTQSMRVGTAGLTISVSIGTAVVEPAIHTEQAGLIAADSALYQSKNSGRNRVSIALPECHPPSRGAIAVHCNAPSQIQFSAEA